MGLWVFYCLVGLHTLLLKWNANFKSSSLKGFLDKFFDLCREYQQIPPQKMAEILREYADRLDEHDNDRPLADLIEGVKRR